MRATKRDWGEVNRGQADRLHAVLDIHFITRPTTRESSRIHRKGATISASVTRVRMTAKCTAKSHPVFSQPPVPGG